MGTTFRPYQPDQMLLLPQDLREWFGEGHLAHHVSDLVDALDLSPFYAPYEGDGRRNSPYDPRMMVKVLVYGYATGTFSSRKLARKLEEDIAFRMLAPKVDGGGACRLGQGGDGLSTIQLPGPREGAGRVDPRVPGPQRQAPAHPSDRMSRRSLPRNCPPGPPTGLLDPDLALRCLPGPSAAPDPYLSLPESLWPAAALPSSRHARCASKAQTPSPDFSNA